MKVIRDLSVAMVLSVAFSAATESYAGEISDRVEASLTDSNSLSSHCPGFIHSQHYREVETTATANPSNWIDVMWNAPAGSEVLLEDGVYSLDRYAIVFEKPLTIRSASGNRDAVVIEGQGYGVNAEALMIMADDVHLADLTVRNVRDHAISIKEGFARSVIYNVNLVDVGTQFIKGSRMGADGVIACSSIGYSTEVGPGDYNGAIDLHAAVGWHIRDNSIYNIYGDGSGCVVDAECGTQWPGGGPAILLWQDSKNNIVERNRIVGSFRGISLGLETPYSGGVVRDNFVSLKVNGKEGVNGFIEADTGISLLGASDVIVEGNTVLLAGNYPGPIELQDAERIIVRNNLVSAPVWNRGNSQYNSCDSRTNDDCDGPEYGNTEIGQMVAVAEITGENEIVSGSDAQPELKNELPENEVSAALTPQTEEAAMAVVDAPMASSREDLKAEMQKILQDLNTAIHQARAERIRGTEERLRMKEERLLFVERMLLSSQLRRPALYPSSSVDDPVQLPENQ